MPTRTTIFATNDNVTANDLNSLAGAWNSYTPQVDQGASTDIAKTVTYAKYLQFGKLVICQVKLSMTGTGTAGSLITVTLPVTAATSALIIGSGQVTDTSTNTYAAIVFTNSSTVMAFTRTDAPPAGSVGADPNFAIANGDILYASIIYEAA